MCSCGADKSKSGRGAKAPPAKGAAGCPPSHATPLCKGLGLNSDANAKEFVDDFKKLQKDWAKLSVADREDRIEKITNKQLAKGGVPNLEVVKEKLPKGNGGHLGFKNWQLALNEEMLSNSPLSDADAKALANAAYHESRHAEQWFLMARKRAADGQDAAEIRDKMQIPGKVADAAKKDPLKAGSCEDKCAGQMHDSVYGKNATSRGKTLTELMSKLKELNKANDQYRTALGDKTATAESKKAAKEAAESALKTFNKVYADYRALPEEADAFDTGGLVDKNW